MMPRRRLDTPRRVLLAAMALVAPALLATHLVQAVNLPAAALADLRTPLERQLRPTSASAAPSAINRAARIAPIGVLYTRGRAEVAWNGVTIPVEDGSYAYVGGETVTLSQDAIGMFRLADGSSVFVCPGSSVRLDRNPERGVALQLLEGSSRFAFPAASGFSVRSADTLIAASQAQPVASRDDLHLGELHADANGRALMCALRNDFALSAGPQFLERARAGYIAELRRDPGRVGPPTVGLTRIAEQVMQRVSAADRARGETQYLCRCEALHRNARDGSRIADAAETLPSTDPLEPETPPELLPPDAPPVALAEPGAPDPFDPNVLPPPAAGEPTDPQITVLPPSVPRGGPGGGGVASPA